MRVTNFTDSDVVISIPPIQFTGDFRIGYWSTAIGPTIGMGSFNDYIRGTFTTVKYSGKTHDLNALSHPNGEKENVFYAGWVWLERIGSEFRTYRGENREELIQTLPAQSTGNLDLDRIGERGGLEEWGGFTRSVIFEDLTDPASTNNRRYDLGEAANDLIAIDSISGQHGTYNKERDPKKTGEFVETSNGLHHKYLGHIKDLATYDKSQAKVFVTFSASILARTLRGAKSRTLMEWEFLQRGADVEVFQFGSGGEFVQTALDEAPPQIQSLIDMGYDPSNITSVVHIGGNDATNSKPYEDNKDTNPYITGMRSRLEALYDLMANANFGRIIWLPISWRNYINIDGNESIGSLPYNDEIVHPFIRDYVGDSSWDSGNNWVKYDFYQYTKDAYVESATWFSDSVHPSEEGQWKLRDQFGDWFAPLFTDTHFPVASIESEDLVITTEERSAIPLNGSISSYLDGAVSAYSWTLEKPEGSGATISDTSAATTSFTPDVDGEYKAILEVTSNDGKTSYLSEYAVSFAYTDTLAPNVTNNGAEPLTLTVGDTYTPDFTALDDNDGALSVTVSDTVDTSTAGTYTVTATATDAAGNVGSATQTVIVEEFVDDVAPVVTNNGSATLTITVGDSYTPDFSTNEGTLDISNPVDTSTAGTYTVTATATDAAGNVGSATQTVIVEAAQQVNQAPTANAGPDQSVAAATQFTLNGTGSQDTDGTIVEWRWTQTAGDTVTLDLSDPARPVGTSPSRSSSQTLTFELVTVDDEGAESNPGTVNINVAAVVLSEVLKVIERLDFDLVTQGDVNAYFGRANREVMKLKPSNPAGLALDADGFIMLNDNTIQEVKVIAEGSSISSNTDSINIEGSEMLVRLGDLEVSKSGNIYFSIIVFVDGDSKGVVVSSRSSSGNKPMSYVTL